MADTSNTHLTVEFTIEPFVPAQPGPHVTVAQQAMIEAMGDSGTVDIGPFGTLASGPPQQIFAGVALVLEQAFSNGAKVVSLQVRSSDSSTNPKGE